MIVLDSHSVLLIRELIRTRWWISWQKCFFNGILLE